MTNDLAPNPIFRIGWAEGETLATDEMPADAALPQLATMLDGAAMGARLRGRWDADGAGPGMGVGPRIEHCQVAYVRYLPGSRCIVGYRLDVADPAGGRRGGQIVCVKAFAEPRSERYLARCESCMRRPSDFGPPFVHLPDLGLFATAFPNDLRMRGLYRLVDRARLKRMLRAAVGAPKAAVDDGGDGAQPIEIVSYKPERSCLVRFGLRPSGSTHETPRPVFARMYHNDRGAQIYRGMQAVWQCAGGSGGTLSVAEPLGYDPEALLLVQAAVPGVPLSARAGGQRFIEAAGAASRGLATLHASTARLERTRTPISMLQSYAGRAAGLAKIDGGGDRLDDCVARLRHSMPTLPGTAQRLIHGDFSLNQILVDGGQVGIIDFDQVCLGDPYMDLGSFLARTEMMVFEGDMDEATAHSATAAFLHDYETAALFSLDRDRLAWYEAVGFIALALSSGSSLKPGWQGRLGYCLARAEQLIERQKQYPSKKLKTSKLSGQ